MSEVEGERIGILSMTYDHSQRGLVTSLLDLEHEFTTITRSAFCLGFENHGFTSGTGATIFFR